MKFLDYEKTIKDSYPILIESYVQQYGEKYRKHITDTINKVAYCLFVTPEDIDAYIEAREKDIYINATIDTLIDLDLDISPVSTAGDGLIIRDERLGDLISFLFFDEDCINKGSYSFIGRMGMSTLDDEKAKKLKSVLDLLYLKYPNTSLYSYIKSSAYEKTASYFKKIYEMFQSHLKKHQENDYSHEDLLAYRDALVNNNVCLLMKHMRDFFVSIKSYLPPQDQEYIEKNPDFNPLELKDFDLYFDYDKNIENNYKFDNGLLDYFSIDYTDYLINCNGVCDDFSKEIIDKRLLYLKHQGYDQLDIDYNSLLGNWYDIPQLNSFLPDPSVLDTISSIKSEMVNAFYQELAQSYIINDYKLRENDAVIDTIIIDNGASCSIANEDLKDGTPKSIICITPICGDYNFFDTFLDHELRHAIETHVAKKGNKVFLKLGTHLAKFTLNDSHNLVEDWSEENRTYNERVTQKLSLEATRSRWENKKFILSNKYALLNVSKNSSYDYDIPNLDLIFEPFREELIEAQISPSFNGIYRIIPRKYLKVINDNISNLTPETKELFLNIATLLEINKNKKKVKQKKMSSQ